MNLKSNDNLITYFSAVVLTLLGLVTLIPFLFIIASSLTTDRELLMKGMVLFPTDGLTLSSYFYIFKKGSGMPNAYLVSIFITVVGTIISLIFSASMAYGLSKRNTPGIKVINYMVLFTMLFNGGIIPTYMVVKSLGLINSDWALILPVLISVYNLLVLKNFFSSIPDSLEESARIDGCNDLVIFLRIVLPLSLPALATIALFYGVYYWNVWFAAVIYINEKSKWPLQLLLRQVIISLDLNALTGDSMLQAPPLLGVKTATIISTVLPILLVYPFLQRHFVKGVMIGAVKG